MLTATRLATTSIPGQAELEVYGILCDGTLVLGCTELDGTRASSADFDAQNGHVHDLRDKAGVLHFAGRYHTHVCAALSTHPFTPEIQYYDTCARPR